MSVDDVPCDIDGDGNISKAFIVAGQDTGIERLNPEWLFKIPGEIEGEVIARDGTQVKSQALKNLDAAYGNAMEYLRDDDRDGFPDIRQKHKPE